MNTAWMNMGTLAGTASCLGDASLGASGLTGGAVAAAGSAASYVNDAAHSVASVWDHGGFAMPGVLGSAHATMASAAYGLSGVPDEFEYVPQPTEGMSLAMAGVAGAVYFVSMAWLLMIGLRSSKSRSGNDVAAVEAKNSGSSSDRPSPLPTDVRTGARREMHSLAPKKGPDNPYERRLHGFMPLMALGAASMMTAEGASHAEYDAPEGGSLTPEVAAVSGAVLLLLLGSALALAHRKRLGTMLSTLTAPDREPKKYGPVTGASMTGKIEGVTGRSLNPEPDAREAMTKLPKAPQVPRF